MKATITNPVQSGAVRQNRKENAFYREYAALIPNRGRHACDSRAIVTVRIYCTNSRAYACLWAYKPDGTISISGGAYAGGYGYHRPSQAVESAFANAGVKLSENIGGVGDDAIERAVIALARELTDSQFLLHVAHA